MGKKSKVEAAMVRYNANSRNKSVGDCVKRALTVAYSMDYDEVSRELARINGGRFEEGYSRPQVYDKFLLARGDKFIGVPPKDRITVEEFTEKNPKGVYVLEVGKTPDSYSSHLVAVVNGNFYDSWNSANYYIYRYAVIKGGKSDVFELDYEAIQKELIWYARNYVEGDLNKKCPDNMFVSVDMSPRFFVYRSVSGGAVRIIIEFGDLPELSKYRSGGRIAHDIAVKMNPRLSAEENESNLKKKLKQKIYDWVYNVRKDILDAQAAESAEFNPNFARFRWNNDAKKILMGFPEWFRPLVTSFDYNPEHEKWGGYLYEAEADALPDDERAESYPTVYFKADTLKELKDQVRMYGENYARVDYDY